MSTNNAATPMELDVRIYPYPTTPRPKSSVSRRNGTIRRSNLISKRHLARLLMLISERSMP